MNKRKSQIPYLLFMSVLFFLPVSLFPTIMVVGGLTYEHTAAPGEEYTGEILLQNYSKEPEEVKIYQTDYFFYADQRVLYGDPGKLPRSNASWITYTPKRVIVPPEQTAKLFYTVQVPTDPTLKGTYWSVFMIEGIPKESPESIASDPEQIGMGIQQAFRYAVQMITHIGKTGKKSIQFIGTRLLKVDQKQQILELDVENTGDLMVRATLWTELYGLDGQYVSKFEAGTLRIYPGTSVRFKVDLTSVPKSNYMAMVVVDCGGESVFGANINLVLKQ
ncbi:MAG: hypothetical protein JXJ04_02675 [Spirochaetales bacterium]|nr:hypothetical protein [Spirochaetales bacterium]